MIEKLSQQLQVELLKEDLFRTIEIEEKEMKPLEVI